MFQPPAFIWVIGWDYGPEGKTEPEIAFVDQSDAEAALALVNKNPSATKAYLVKVPVWKQTRAVS